MKNPVFTIQLVEDQTNYWITTIKVFKSGPGGGKMLFGADAMWQWEVGASPVGDGSRNHIRNHAQSLNWAEWLHNGLSGMHACILHAGYDEFCIHDKHDDYAFVSRLFDLAHLSDAEVLAQTGGIIPESCK